MASSDYERDFTEVTQLTTGLRQVAEQLASIGEQYRQATAQLIQARVAIRLLEARVPIKAEEFGLDVASLDAAQAREVEALTTRDSSCHSVHEVRAALQRRLQLGLALKLADSGGLAGDSNAADRVLPAVTQLQTLAGDYPTKRELAEALAVLDRLIQVRDDEGESPMLARALAAQLAAVNSFRPQPSYLPAEVHAHPKAHLVLARKPKDGGAAELDLLRNQTRQWFANYQDHLDLLVEFAQAGESPVAG